MASSTTPDIVEQVARTICRHRLGVDPCSLPVHDMDWPAGEEWRNHAWASDVPVARAAVTATLAHAKSHVSRDMILAARRVKHLRVPKRAPEEVMFGAMVEVLLQEIGDGK